MRTILALAILGLAGMVEATAHAAAPPVRPLNVLCIMVDDLGCRLGCYGDPQVQSPHIDRLAQKGMRFDRAYVQYSVCNPSRASLLSGWRPDRTGILDNEMPLRTRHPEVVTLPQRFRQHGYYTASLGKVFHAGVDERGKKTFFQDAKSWDDCRSFEVTAAGRRGTGRDLGDGSIKWCRWQAAEGTDEDQPDGQIAAAAMQIIEARRDRPFFLAVGFHKPHDPFIAPAPYFAAYPLEQIALAPEPADRSPLLPLALPGAKTFDSFTDQDRREFRRAYFAGVSFTDAQIGKLFATLDRLELWESTIVVVLGDHGYHLGEHGWWNKVTLFEHGARAPLVMWAPEAKGMGKPTAGIVEFVDLYPTLTALAGIDAQAGDLDGQSFAALLDDPSAAGKTAAFTQITRGAKMGRSVRTARFRYTEWNHGQDGVELYDHHHDPLEYHNLADVAEHAATRAEHAALLKRGRP